MKKTLAVLGLAAVSNAINNNYVDDEYFGLGIDIKSKVQTADVSRSHGRINVNMKDDADNELHNYFSMPHNKGDIQFNDYTVKGGKKDDADDEYFLDFGIKSKVQTVNANHARGMININMKDDADNELHSYYSMPHNKGNIQFNDYSKAKDDEFFGLGIDVKSKVQTADVSRSHGRINVNMKDDADDELFGLGIDVKSKVQTADVSRSHGRINVNMKDDADDELFGLDIGVKSKVQTANVSRSRGQINVNMKDDEFDADNELHNYYSMPHNKGNIQFNDYTKAKDDELFGLGIDVKSKVQTANVSRSRGQINVNMKDDADDELFGLGIDVKSKVQTADVSRSHGRINVNMKDDADDELFGLGIDVKSKVQTADVSRSHGRINVNMKDDADNELHNYFSMPHNKGDIQFNDYTVKGGKKDDADDEYFLDFGIKSKVQTVNANHARGMININMKDDEFDADNELHNYYTMPHNKGNIQFNDYSKAHDDEYFGLGINVKSKVQTADVSHSRGRINVNMQDDADDEFFAGKGNHKDEIELLRSLLKHATQDQNGNVIVDGVKIGKIPRAKEHTKPLKTNSSSKAQPELPKRKFLAL